MAVDKRPLPLLAVTLAWCLALALLGAQDGILFLAPALLLAVPLAARVYPGETQLRRLVAARARPLPRAARATAPASRFARVVPRGSLLLATSSAERAPPFAAVAAV